MFIGIFGHWDGIGPTAPAGGIDGMLELNTVVGAIEGEAVVGVGVGKAEGAVVLDTLVGA